MRIGHALKKHLVRFVLGGLCVVAFMGHAAHFWQVPFVSVLDAYLYDVRVRFSAPNTVDDRVVIIDVDEKSLAEVGRWPWGRDKIAAMVRNLTDHYKVKAVGFDVVFAEPDESSGLKILESIGRHQLKGNRDYQSALQGMRANLDYDQVFAQTLKGRPVVLGYYFSSNDDARTSGMLPPPVVPEGVEQSSQVSFIRWRGYGANLPLFQKAAASGGHFNPIVDFDGISRRVPLLVEHEGHFYQSLSLATLRLALGTSTLRLGFPDQESTLEWLEIDTPDRRYSIPVDEAGAALIPYRGPERSFPYIPAVDVIKRKVDPSMLKDKIVIVGTTAPGLNDLRATPVGATYPGVEVHANLIAGMLDERIKQKPSYVVGVETLILLIFGGTLALLLPLLSPMWASVLTAAVTSGLVGLNFWFWQASDLVLPLAGGLLLLIFLYALNMSWGYFVESKTKRQFTALFGQYVPPELVDEMAKDPENYSMEGRNEELTVLFSDVRSFTTISEGLDPKELTQLMNAYLGTMTTVIRQHRGTLDKYIGDAIMAFWGAPVADQDHARHAVLTALEMQKALRSLDEPFRARGWPELHIGVGVNTGVMTVGDMGSPVRQSYTVMGDAVNLGSRLEGITKQYGVGIIVGETTQAKLPDMAFRELDRVRVKGKDEPVGIYEPIGLADEVPPAIMAEIESWQQALLAYRAQQWDKAEGLLRSLSQAAPSCKLYRIYLERIGHLRESPPGDNWDGVTTFETK